MLIQITNYVCMFYYQAYTNLTCENIYPVFVYGRARPVESRTVLPIVIKFNTFKREFVAQRFLDYIKKLLSYNCTSYTGLQKIVLLMESYICSTTITTFYLRANTSISYETS